MVTDSPQVRESVDGSAGAFGQKGTVSLNRPPHKSFKDPEYDHVLAPVHGNVITQRTIECESQAKD